MNSEKKKKETKESEAFVAKPLRGNLLPAVLGLWNESKKGLLVMNTRARGS